MKLDDPTAALLARRAQPGLRLLRAEDAYAHIHLIESKVPICEWALRLHPPEFVDRLIPDLSRRHSLDKSVTTLARVEGGAWIAECPFCPSAQRVTPLDPRFICAGLDGCLNGAVRGAYVEVVFPGEATRDQIEVVLLERLHRSNRNWLPHETVADLVRQNEDNENGIEIDYTDPSRPQGGL